MQTQQPGQPAHSPTPQPEPQPEPITPPSEPLTPPSEPLTPPSEPLTPQPEPVTPVPEPVSSSVHAQGVPVPLDHPFAQQLAIAEASLEETREAMRNAEAELEHIRRRVLDDISRARKYAIEGFVQAVLPVKDSLETALQVETPSVDSVREGLALTLRQLDAAFDKNGLAAIDPAPGERLDPLLHKPISMASAPRTAHTVVSVLQKGYRIGERVLRPALVTVASARADEAKGEAQGDEKSVNVTKKA